ncbi:hypothetical protein AVEN_96399-1 [Araneus ventricosus]|uniref:DUF4817 domain-containing protein n=1 Tax=Araneus ventricosus TaxID=182803 RepID=A0A4Y2J1V5_ARAVE|nr:hypothetical protein AVEN_96399-1 [Araneus ventricosus]
MATVQEKAMCYWFSKLNRHNYSTSLQDTYKKDPPSDNSIERWLHNFRKLVAFYTERGRRPSTSQENVDRIQETFTRSPRKSMRKRLCSYICRIGRYGTFSNRLHLNAYNANCASFTRMI